MANPQLEHGYLRLANELYEAWMRTRVPGEAEQVLKAIIRKTYGFRKKVDRISISQIAAMTRMSSPHVCRAVKKLLKMKMITQKGNGYHVTYGIQKDYDKWKPLPKRAKLPLRVLPIRANTKDITYKDKDRSPASPDLVEKRIADGTHSDKCDAIIKACKSYLNLGCSHAQAGQINKKAESVGQVIVSIYRTRIWISSKKDFVGAIIRDLSEARGSTDKDGKNYPGWPDSDWDMVKAENERFEKYLDQKHGSSLGKVLKRLTNRDT